MKGKAVANSPITSNNEFRALQEYRGAYTDLSDLIRLRYAARKIKELTGDKTSNPLAGLLSSNLRGRGVDFAEVRIYQPGDDVRTIDWRVTARTQMSHTKVFQEEKERPVLILIDQSTSMYFGSEITFKSVLAARTASIIAWSALDRGDRVGGSVFSENEHREIRPRRSKKAVLRLLSETHDLNHKLKKESATADTSWSKSYFGDALSNVRRVTKHGSVIFIISDFANVSKECLIHLQPLARHSDLIGIHISDALEQQLPSPDMYTITDGSERTRINTASKKTRDAYALNFNQHMTEVKDEFMRVKAPLLRLQTHQSILSELNHQAGIGVKA